MQDLWGRSALMVRRTAAAGVGPVDTGPPRAGGEMVDWLARAREPGVRLRMTPDALVGRRRIATSLTHGQDASALLPTVRAALARKRR